MKRLLVLSILFLGSCGDDPVSPDQKPEDPKKQWVYFVSNDTIVYDGMSNPKFRLFAKPCEKSSGQKANVHYVNPFGTAAPDSINGEKDFPLYIFSPFKGTWPIEFKIASPGCDSVFLTGYLVIN